MLFNSLPFLFLPLSLLGFFALGAVDRKLAAYRECHARIFSRYWRDSAAGRAGPDLYRP